MTATFGIGHNGGPQSSGAGFRAHCWRKARRELLGANLPIEVVRQQVRRAKALGLDYKTYAGVRATTGRDLVAFLYSTNALGMFRLADQPDAMTLARMNTSVADRHLGVGPGLNAEKLRLAAHAVSATTLPPFGSSWGAMRAQLKSWLGDQRLPADAVLMIGETDHEREMMAAAGFAGFLTGQRYFAGDTHAV
ncbi:MAG: hypothetical protein DI498_06580 [Paracoccus denitrificans]|nr:MAG: hypothetical protein DI498_06580 [Paracoccus denitrificans]PZO84748.1 MAG: hypothetical protein DI633_06580 [Paracoccus denitrificans]